MSRASARIRTRHLDSPEIYAHEAAILHAQEALTKAVGLAAQRDAWERLARLVRSRSPQAVKRLEMARGLDVR
jgi:hypothetical protein